MLCVKTRVMALQDGGKSLTICAFIDTIPRDGQGGWKWHACECAIKSDQVKLRPQTLPKDNRCELRAPWKNWICSTTMKLRKSLVKPVNGRKPAIISSCSVLPPEIIMHDAYIGGRSENNIKCVVVHDLGRNNRTTRYNCRFSAASLALWVIFVCWKVRRYMCRAWRSRVEEPNNMLQ